MTSRNATSHAGQYGLHFLRWALLLIGLVAAPLTARGDTLYWDANGSSSGTGGAGTWGTSNTWRLNSTGGTLTSWSDGDDAIFQSTAGTVGLSGNRAVNNMTFNTTLYSVTSSSSTTRTLTLSGDFTVNISGTGSITIGNSSNDMLFSLSSGDHTFDISDSDSANFVNTIQGSGGAITKTGNGTLEFSGSSSFANTYTGLTTVNAGTLYLHKSDNVVSVAGNLTIGDGSGTDVVRLGGDGQFASTSIVTINTGGILRTDGNQLTIGGLVGTGLVTNDNGSSSSDTVLTLNVASGQTYDFSGVIQDGDAGDVGITKSGAGTQIFSGANIYDNATSITGGVLNLRHSTALGDAGTGTTVSSGAALELQGGIAIGTEALSLSGTGISNGGALRNISEDNSWAGAITLGADSRINSDAGTLTLSGGITGNIAGRDLIVGGAGDTIIQSAGVNTSTGAILTKDGIGTLTINASGNFTGGTVINAGTLVVGTANALGTSGTPVVNSGGTLAIASGITFTRATTFNSGSTLAGKGTYSPSLTLTGAHVAPGIDDIGTLTIGNSTTFGAGGVLDIEVNGATTDLLHVTGTLNTSSTTSSLVLSMTSPTLGKYKIADFTTAISSGTNLASNGGFGSVTGLNSSYRISLVTGANGEIDLIHKADQTLTAASPATINIITGATIGVSATLTNTAPSGSDALGVTLANNSGTGGAVSGLTSSTGATVSAGSASTINGTFTAGSVGTGKTWSIKNTDANAVTTTVNAGGNVNVYNHSAPTLSITSGNNQTVFVGGTLSNASLTLSNTSGSTPAPLDVSSLSNLTGSTGSGVVASGGTGTYTSTALNNSVAGIGKTLAVSLNAGDQQTITGASALSPLNQTITYNVYNHAAPTLTVATGNNQSVIAGSALSTATATLSNPGSASAPLDVNTLSNLTGSTGTNVITTGNTGTYTATGFNNSVVGIGKTLAVSLNAGDPQSLTGHNALSALNTSFTYNVYNHSAPTLSITSGNNQTVFVGGTLSNASLTLSNTSGSTPAPLDVSSLSNLTGSTGSGVVASGGTGTYTSTALNNSVAGIGKTLAVSLNAGDQQTITGASALSPLNQTITYNVYNHAAPTLTVATGNNQSVIAGSALSTATATLSNPGSASAPLDVNTLSNLTGSTGTNVVTTGNTGTYTATGFNNSVVGIGKTLAVSLNAGDPQSLTGHNALSALNTSFTYNVYNHSAPTLSITSGNNQTVFVGGTLSNASLTLSNTSGSTPAPLDVSSLSNLTGSTGSGVVASGGTGTYTSTALNNSVAGIGKTLAVSLNAGDQQTITGASALSPLNQTITYNVYNHAAPTLTVATGNNQSVIINNALSAATATLANTAGTVPAPLDVNTLSNLTGSTGTNVVASGGTGTYTASGFVINSVGINKSLAVSLKAGDQQSITGANALSTLNTNFTYSVYNHAAPTLSITSGNNQTGFVGGTLANATLTLSNTAGTTPAPLDVSSLSNLTGSTGSGVVASGGTGSYSSTALDTTVAGLGKTLAVSLNAGDQQTITGASALSPLNQTITYNVYNHAAPTLTIASGNNQSVIINNALSAATATLSNPGSLSAPLDVNTLSNLTGSTGTNVVTGGSTGTYTATGFNNTVAGVGKTLAVSLNAGDPQSLTGHNALSNLSQTFTYNVYDHASGSVGGTTLAIPDVIVGYTSAVASSNSINVTNAAGARVNLKTTNNGPQNFLSLNNVSGVVAGTSNLLTASLAPGKGVSNFSQGITLTYADDSALAGAASSGLGTQSIFVTGNVYGHASGSVGGTTLTIPDVFVGYASPVNSSSSISVSNLVGFRVNLKTTNDGPQNSLSLGNVAAVVAGNSASINASLATGKAAGNFSQVITLTYADDSTLPGASSSVSTQAVTINGNVYTHAAPTLTIAGGNNQSVIAGTALSAATVSLANPGSTSAPLDVNTLSNLTGSTGSGIITAGNSGTYTATGFNNTIVGIGKTVGVSLKAGDKQTISGANALSTLGATFNYNVYNHSTPTLTLASGNNQTGFVGSTLSNATFTLSNTTGTTPAPLDVNTLNNLTGSTGSGVVSSGGTGGYTSTALDTSVAGIGKTLAVSLKAGDQQTIAGANALSTLNQTVTYTVYDHAAPTLTIASGNNQSVIAGTALSAATVTLANTAGSVPAPLDVNTLSNLTGSTGSGVVASGGTGSYTATGFNNSVTGIGKSLAVSLNAGDQQSIAGANPLSTLGTTFTYNVYNHSTPTLSVASGDNQSVFVGGPLSSATFTLSNTTGTTPAPLDVNTLSNLTGSTGSGVVASGSTGTYTSTALDNSVAGIGKTLAVSLKAGDQQTIAGANALSTLNQTITYNVYDHAAPTLTIAGGNNQSVFVNNALAAATVTLSNPGSTSAPLDVNTLSNLTGSTGSGVVAAGNTGTYTATGFDNSVAGIGKSLAVGLDAGDQQSISGANPLSTLSTDFTYNVYNHSTPTLTIATGNNQSVFVGGTLSNATLTLSDTIGDTPAPLDVNTLSNLTGTTGSGVVASGSTGTYTSTALDNSVAGIGKTLAVSLDAGDQQTIAGANALSTLNQTITYNVYDHAAPTLSITSGNNQSVFVGDTLVNATFTLSNTTGGTPAPLDVSSLSNLTGSTGSGVVASGGTGIYTSTALNSSVAGIGKTLAVSLDAGDQQTIVGANPLSTLNQTITYNVYDHSVPTLTIASGNNQSVIINNTLATATATLANPGSTAASLDVNTLSNLTGSTGSGVVAAGSTGTYTATGFDNSVAGIGKSLSVSLKAGDPQSVAGANGLSALSTDFTYNVYDHASGSVDGTNLTIPDVFVGYASPVASSDSINTSNASGVRVNLKATNDGPLGSLSLNDVSGVTAGSNAAITASLATGKAAGSFSQEITLTYADDSALAGASSNQGTQAITVSGNVYDHASGSVVGGTALTIPNVIVGYSSAVDSSASVTFNNAAGFRVNLKTTNDGPQNLVSVTDLSGAAANSNGTVNGSLAIGKGVGGFSEDFTLTYADDSGIAGASSNLGTQTVTVSGVVLNHAAPSLSVSSVDFGNVLQGAVVSSTDVDLNNASGPNRADLVLTAVDEGGHVSTLTRSGSSAGSIAAGDSLTNAIGLNTSTPGAFAATYDYEVEDQDLPGKIGLPTQSLSASANVYAPAELTANTATTLNHGSAVSIENAAAAPLRADAYVESYAISSRWTLDNLAVGAAIAPGTGTASASVSFDNSGLLNGQTLTGTLSIALENDQAIYGAAHQDLGQLDWNLSQLVTGSTGSAVAEVAAGGSYAGLNGVSDKALGTKAMLLGGSNASDSPIMIETSWRNRTLGETNGFAASLPSTDSGLVSDVLTLTGADGSTFVLEMSVSPAVSSLADVILAWLDDSGVWRPAIEGNHELVDNTTNSALLDFQGSWLNSGAGLTLGAYGYDGVSHTVWAVLNHNSNFAALNFSSESVVAVPEPTTLILAAVGGLLILLHGARKFRKPAQQ